MGYYHLPLGNADVELGRKIYMQALSGRQGFQDDHLGIKDIDIWSDIFEAIGKAARAALASP